MSPEFEKFLMEKINLLIKIGKWILIIWFVCTFLGGFLITFLN